MRSELSEALDRLANRRNLERRRLEFCFETSEDAITWTVFRGLEEQGRLDALLASGHRAGEATLLLWGAPISGSRRVEAAEALTQVCRSLGETAS